jgi:hypothetical protein
MTTWYFLSALELLPKDIRRIFFSIVEKKMSRNPHYTGNQTYSIPTKIASVVGALVAGPVRGTSTKQDIANIGGSLPDLMRPKTEGWWADFQPLYVRPDREVFNLETVAKRRSQDKELK